jgi:type II secretory pathway pseudopilin PulG
MSLLEILIVLAIIALIMGVVIGPKVIGHYRRSQRTIATLAVHRLADQDYPVWAVAHPSTPCPSGIPELTHTSSPMIDPWGSEYELHCGATAPPETAFGASSFGEDRRDATTDDILSWRD